MTEFQSISQNVIRARAVYFRRKAGLRPTPPQSKRPRVNREKMQGRVIWFPILHKADPTQREQVEIGSRGVSLHRPELDEDLSVANLLAGADWRST